MDNTPNSPKVKRCSKGDDCIHPKGPVLPRTEEYFYMSSGKAGSMCRACMKAYRRQRHSEQRDKENANSTKYYEGHKERYRHYGEKYKIRKLHNGGKHTHAELDQQYKSQKGCCWYCGKFVGLMFDIDHRVPVSQGGSNDISNIVIACRECNQSKGDKLPHEWGERLI